MTLGPTPYELTSCSTVGCNRPSAARSLCRNCYQSARRGGRLDATAPRDKGVRIRVYVTQELERKLHRLCRATGQHVSQVVRALIEERLKAL